MKGRQTKVTTGHAAKSLPKDCIAEWSGDQVYTNYWIKIGLPRTCLSKLKALGQQLGFKQTPTAAAVRLIVLSSMLHQQEIESWLAEVNVKYPGALKGSKHKGCDPAQN